MDNLHRRDFLKKSGVGLVAAATSGLWYDLLFAGKIPKASSLFFEENFGVSREDMKKVLEIGLSKGGEFSELFFEYRIANSVSMEENIIKESSERINLGVGIRVLKGEKTGYGYTNDMTLEKMKQTALTAAAIASSGGKINTVDLTEKTIGHQVYDLDHSLHNMELGKKSVWLKKLIQVHRTMIIE